MGPNVKPQFDEEDKNHHIETVIEVFILHLEFLHSNINYFSKSD